MSWEHRFGRPGGAYESIRFAVSLSHEGDKAVALVAFGHMKFEMRPHYFSCHQYHRPGMARSDERAILELNVRVSDSWNRPVSGRRGAVSLADGPIFIVCGLGNNGVTDFVPHEF